MGRRSDFERLPKDFYRTIDPNAVPETFLSFIRGKTYAEPCYGGGDLEGLIGHVAECKWRSDLDPDPDVPSLQKNATMLTQEDLKGCDVIVTNPPYKWEMLQPLLDHLPTLKPTWLLLPANVMHNKRMGYYMERCHWVVTVGRLFWFKSQWVEKFNLGRVDKPKSGEVYVDYLNGDVYYTGWYDFTNNKPTKSEYTRSTEDYCWYNWDYSKTHEHTKFVGSQ